MSMHMPKCPAAVKNLGLEINFLSLAKKIGLKLKTNWFEVHVCGTISVSYFKTFLKCKTGNI